MAYTLVFSCILLVLCGVAQSSSIPRCPESCDCLRTEHGVTADCFRRGIDQLPPVSQFDPDTVSIDLRHNSLQVISADGFAGLPRLGWLGLDDNQIDTLETYAFRGLQNLTHLSLTNNRLTTLLTETFYQLAGDPNVCPGVSAYLREDVTNCHIDLRNNDIVLINRYAFSSVNRLSISLGGASSVGLLVDKYGFYLLSHATKISFSNLNSVTLRPYAFTNVQYVGVLELLHTELVMLDADTFVGLEHLGELRFSHSRLGSLNTYSVSGITFLPRAPRTSRLVSDTKSSKISSDVGYTGGLLNISHCDVTIIQKDLARGTNLNWIRISHSNLRDIGQFAFRGLQRLKLELLYNTIGKLTARSLGGIQQSQELRLHSNTISAVETNAFEDSKDIDLLSMSLPAHSSTTLHTRSFSDLVGVGNMEFVGLRDDASLRSNTALPSGENTNDTDSKPRLIVMPDAFSGLMVEHLTFTNLHLPVLTHNAFRGLTKVTKLRLVDCDVTRVESGAFGEAFGAVQHLDMSEGNLLPCDCQSRDTLRELNKVMSQTKLSCVLGDQTISVDDSDLQWPLCASAAGRSSLIPLLLFILPIIAWCQTLT